MAGLLTGLSNMAAITSELKKIFTEDIAANGSLSEGLLVKIGATLNSVIDNHLWQIGDVRVSALTEAQFAAANGYDIGLPMEQRRWVRIEGQSISGSAFSALTGINSLPNALANGAHLEQTKNASILQYFVNQNKDHNHGVGIYPSQYQGQYNGILAQNTLNPARSGTRSSDNEGGDVARPNSVTVNFFIKINN